MDPYKAYVRERLEVGGVSLRALWRELRDRGFTGSHTTAYKYAVLCQQQLGIVVQPLPRSVAAAQLGSALTPRGLAALVLFRPEQVSDKQRQLIVQACQLHPDIAEATRFAQAFAAMLRARDVAPLAAWLQQVSLSTLQFLKSFVVGCQRDLAAVEVALTLSWSNGTVEGHVNRLKFIKRQMFGRAQFDLLRIRVLLKPSMA